MGKNIFDFWSLGHFLFGIITTSALIPSQPMISLIITNLVHLSMELIENNVNEKTGEVLETEVNHLSDILFFYIGSLIGFFYGYPIFEKYFILRVFVLILSALTYLQEILREIYPHDWYFDSAYKPFNW